ncbi:MAG: helix-turn-helix domain-containing protein [Candidatus Limnocylindrales bacterium]
MATLQRRLDRGRDQAERIFREAGAEIRLTRRGAGVSIRAAAASVGMSETMFGRIERGRLPQVTVTQLAVASAAVGLRFAGRAYPDGDPVRDEAHTRLLQRFRDELPVGTPWRLEVPLPIPGDRRAWDAQCVLDPSTVAVEAEMRLSDLQALDRRIALKRRDGSVGLVVLLIADTHANRRHLAENRELLRPSFPLDSRAILAAVRLGQPPSAPGIVVL